MNVIKLIIWDLDETFWHGTLSEEGISVIDDNVELIKKLTSKGIINSISSKNNHDEAKSTLLALGVWEYFVFPKIGWYSKANAIKDTIETMGLRPVNVLFIDDNHLNLQEVSSVIPNINVLHPSSVGDLENRYDLKGKSDADLTRLNQYKLLEKKFSARTHYDTDLDFLFSCEINVQIKKATIDTLERVHELIQRTNQLNFTKKRLELGPVKDLLISSKKNCYVVFVNDKFGDYGLVGFVSIDKKENKLEHYCFSCRTINLGIEQFIYNYFGYPEIKVVGDTAVKLTKDFKPDWIKLVENDVRSVQIEAKGTKRKILFKGGCDLSQMTFYLNGTNDIIEETNFVTKSNITVHAEHSNILLQKTKYDKGLPYLPLEAFDSLMFEESFDYVIYSVLMDYTQDLYENVSGNIIPLGGYSNKVDLKKLSEEDATKMRFFYENYKNIGQIKPDDFYHNLEEILSRLDPKTKLLLINGAEVEPVVNTEPFCIERHKLMNEVVDRFCKTNRDRVLLIDVRKHIKSSEHVTNNLRHYKRSTYKHLAEDVSTILNLTTKRGNASFLFYLDKLLSRMKRIFRTL